MQTESHEVSTEALEWSIKEGCEEGLLNLCPAPSDRSSHGFIDYHCFIIAASEGLLTPPFPVAGVVDMT